LKEYIISWIAVVAID